jgi:ATP-binding cassette subfamily C protein
MQRYLQQISQTFPAYEDLTTAAANARSGADSTGGAAETERLAISLAGAELRGVTTGYCPGRPVLHDVSLSIGAHETVALVGPSGAGKTTVVDVLAGLLPPERGSVHVNSRALEGGLMRQWRSSIAVVTQEPFLLHSTVRANLRWGSGAATEPQLWQALEVAAATELVQSLPAGLDTVVGDRGVRMSGGERQRIALARAVLRRPALLILDEATSAIDNESELLIRRALSGLRGEFAMLVVAHRLSTASDADRVVVLDGGRVVESGGWDELLELPQGKLRALVQAGSLGGR